jgi:hypothetical protein
MGTAGIITIIQGFFFCHCREFFGYFNSMCSPESTKAFVQ